MATRNLDGLLLFQQESLYYLMGYDTTGYVAFQCLLLLPEGAATLLTRQRERLQAELTSSIEDIRTWQETEDADPVAELASLLEGAGCRGRRLGIELNAWGMTATRWQQIQAGLDGFCQLVDASDLVSELRLIKSPAEIACARRAAELADLSLAAAARLCLSGAYEGDIVGAMQGALFRGGGDYPNGMVAGSGPGALMVRGYSGYRKLDPNDQMQLEFAGAYRHYHAALMRTILTGGASDYQLSMHEACVAALTACQQACRPGQTFGQVFDAQAQVFDKAGFENCRLKACGYSLGATFGASWMDYPMLFSGNPVEIQPHMVIFLHMILLDSEAATAMSLGETVVVGEGACQRLSAADWKLIVN
jgi:Xaa-Pro dipeptidase